MSSSHLREGDLDVILRIVNEGHRDDPAEGMPWTVLEGLQRLVPCDREVAFMQVDFQERRNGLRQWIEAGRRCVDGEGLSHRDDPFWLLFWISRFCSHPQQSGELTSVIHDGDFYGTDGDRRSDPMHCDLQGPAGYAHCMIVSMPAPTGQVRRILFRRGPGQGFTERERQVVALLRPHLCDISAGAERRRNGVPNLTRREWEVLRLSAVGLSNADIARQLVVSSATVRKHMEHILKRLGVHNRNSAAAMALPHTPHRGMVAPLVRN